MRAPIKILSQHLGLFFILFGFANSLFSFQNDLFARNSDSVVTINISEEKENQKSRARFFFTNAEDHISTALHCSRNLFSCTLKEITKKQKSFSAECNGLTLSGNNRARLVSVHGFPSFYFHCGIPLYLYLCRLQI